MPSSFQNPVEHSKIAVKEAVFVNASEALVVYRVKPDRRNSLYSDKPPLESSQVERVILNGPLRYIPQPNEWMHEFRWHGADPTNKTRKIPDGLVFKKLRTIADQLYYNVSENR